MTLEDRASKIAAIIAALDETHLVSLFKVILQNNLPNVPDAVLQNICYVVGTETPPVPDSGG